MRKSAAILLSLMATVFCLEARADDPRVSCIESAEKAQNERDSGKYRAARRDLVTCSNDACPGAVRSDCSRWLAELESATPTVVFSVRDVDGRDVAAVRLLVDGELLAERLDGRPIMLDPGEHVFRYELQGRAPIEEMLVIRSSERDRVVRVKFAGSTREPSVAPAATETKISTSSTHSPLLAIGAGAVAALAVGSFTYFGLRGVGDLKDLESQPCAVTKTCATSDADNVRTKFLIADVSLGVGVVALGVVVYDLLARRSSSPAASPTTGLNVQPTMGGGAATIAF